MNWGTKSVIGMAVFMGFILILATRMIISSGDDALIDNNYYEKGLAYTGDYNKKQNAFQDSVIPEIDITPLGLTISFPIPVHYKLTLKRPNNSKMDLVFEGYTDEERCVEVPAEQLAKGTWFLKIEYTKDEEHYLFEKEISVL